MVTAQTKIRIPSLSILGLMYLMRYLVAQLRSGDDDITIHRDGGEQKQGGQTQEVHHETWYCNKHKIGGKRSWDEYRYTL